MQKLILFLGINLLLLGLLVTPTLAAPYKAADNNPQVVAAYIGDLNAPHGVPAETCGNHFGDDLVMRAGNSGNFQQWLYGTQPCAGDGLHGDHDLWKLSKDGTCPEKAFVVHQPNIGDPNYPGWGDYLVPGGTYCVLNNDFHPDK